jgi:hypothetical protein
MFLPMALREHVRQVTLPGPDGTPVPLVADERTLFESTAPDPPAAPPLWLPWYLAVGAVVGALAVALGVGARRRTRWSGVGLGTLSAVWGTVGGLGGLVLAGLWAFTDHAMAYRNENLFQLNPLLLGLPVLVPLGLAGFRRAARWARALALIVAGLSLLGLVLQALPGLDQVNGPIIALLLPVHVGIGIGVWLALGQSGSSIPSVAAST